MPLSRPGAGGGESAPLAASRHHNLLPTDAPQRGETDPLEHLLECLRVSMCRGGFSSHVCEALLVAEQAACCQSSDQRILSQLTRCSLGGEDQIRGLNFPSSRLVGEGSYEGGAFEH